RTAAAASSATATRRAATCSAARTARATRGKRRCRTMPKRLIRYAVVGCGHIAQVAVLPAFGNARRNSKLVAIVSGDPVKRAELQRKYEIPRALDYEHYDELLKSGDIDAVYIALPNSMHAEYT